jgi:hypothetical protein
MKSHCTYGKRTINNKKPGDQCGRDMPPENIFKLVEVARTYGKY